MNWKTLGICLALLLTVSIATDTLEEPTLEETETANSLEESLEARDPEYEPEFEPELLTNDELELREESEAEESDEGFDLTERQTIQQCPSRIICGGRRCCPHNGYTCRGSNCVCLINRRCGTTCCRRGLLCSLLPGRRPQCVDPRFCDWQSECGGRYCCGNEQRCISGVAGVFCQNSPRNCRHNWYTTYNKNQWGGRCPQSRAACWLQQRWRQCFPRGNRFGCPNNNDPQLTFTNLPDVQEFVQNPPNSTDGDSITTDVVNPSEGSEFWGNLVSLGLNLGFDNCREDFSIGCQKLRDLWVCDRGQRYFRNRCRPYYNMKVSDIYNTANRALGGCCTAGRERCDIENLNDCMMAINNAFSGGRNLGNMFDDEFSSRQCPRR